MRHICYTLSTIHIPTPHLHFLLHFSFPHFDYTHWLIKNAPHLLHFAYTPHSHTTPTLFDTLFFPTLHTTHLLIKNAPHLLHFAYTLHSHTTSTLLLHFFLPTLMQHICYTLATLGFPTLWLHIFVKQKCATFVTLCHVCYTFATLFLSHTLPNTFPIVLHSATLIGYTFPTLLSTLGVRIKGLP